MEEQKNNFLCFDTGFIAIYIKYLNRIFKLNILDVLDKQARSRSFTRGYLLISSIYLIFYDAFNRESFNTLKDYCDRILSIDEKRFIIILRSKYELNVESKENIDIVSDEEVLEYINNKNDNDNIFFFHLSNYEKYESGINNLLEFIIIKSIKQI